MRPRSLLFAAVFAALAGCTTGRAIRPVGRERTAVGLSVGGPMVRNLGPPLPLPAAAVFVRHGLGARTDLDAAIYLPMSRSAGADLGASTLVLGQPSRALPALMVGGRLLALAPLTADWRARRRAGRQFVELTSRWSWAVGPYQLLYCGLDATLAPRAPWAMAHLGLGWQGQLHPRWTMGAELRWLDVTRSNAGKTVAYQGIGQRGGLAVQVGLSYLFAEPRR